MTLRENKLNLELKVGGESDNPTSRGNTLTPFHQLLYLDKCRIHNTLADAIQGRPYTDGGGGRGVDTPMRIAYERDFAF